MQLSSYDDFDQDLRGRLVAIRSSLVRNSLDKLPSDPVLGFVLGRLREVLTGHTVVLVVDFEGLADPVAVKPEWVLRILLDDEPIPEVIDSFPCLDGLGSFNSQGDR